MLRHFPVVARARGAKAAVRGCTVTLVLLGVLCGCGIKGPLRPATPAGTAAAGSPPSNPEARPPLLPSEPPAAIVPPEPAKKP